MKLAYLSALANAAIIGCSFLFMKLALAEATPLDTLLCRFAIAFGVLTVPVCLGKIRIPRVQGRSLLALACLAALYPIGFFILQSFGLLEASSGEGGIL